MGTGGGSGYIVMEALDLGGHASGAALGEALARMHAAEPLAPEARAGKFGCVQGPGKPFGGLAHLAHPRPAPMTQLQIHLQHGLPMMHAAPSFRALGKFGCAGRGKPGHAVLATASRRGLGEPFFPSPLPCIGKTSHCYFTTPFLPTPTPLQLSREQHDRRHAAAQPALGRRLGRVFPRVQAAGMLGEGGGGLTLANRGDWKLAHD